MASAKDTFGAKTFAATTFAAGAWRGVGIARKSHGPAGQVGINKDVGQIAVHGHVDVGEVSVHGLDVGECGHGHGR